MKNNVFMEYNTIGKVKMKSGKEVPLLDIPMMSDERWNELAKEQAIKNYARVNGKEPKNAETALKWQRKWLMEKEEL